MSENATDEGCLTPRRFGPRSLYDALKQQQAESVQAEASAEELFWTDSRPQSPVREAARRLEDEALVQRIQRRVQGDETIVLPSAPWSRLWRRQTPRTNDGWPSTVNSIASAPEGEQQESERRDGDNRSSRRLHRSGRSSGGGGSGNGSSYSYIGPCEPNPEVDQTLSRHQLSHAESHEPLWQSLCPSFAAVQLRRAGGGTTIEAAVPPSLLASSHRAAAVLVQHPDFENTVLLLVVASCVVLALQRPLEVAGSPWNAALATTGLALNIAFTVELLLRYWAACSAVEYLRSPWNLLDVAVVAAGYAGTSAGSGAMALRALRALRPLRAVSRIRSLRVVVVCLVEAVPLLASVCGFLAFLLLLFSVAGTQLFMDDFYRHCTNAVGQVEQPDDVDAEDFGCGWRHCPVSYTCQDYQPSLPLAAAGYGNVGLSTLSVFQIITTTDWSKLMYRSMDASGPFAVAYYVLLVFCGAFFMLSLFVAVLYAKFARARSIYLNHQQQDGSTENKARSILVLAWGHLARRLRPLLRAQTWQRGRVVPDLLSDCPAPAAAPSRQLSWRQRIEQVIEHPYFGYVFLAFTLSNAAVLATYHADISEAQEAQLNAANSAFSCVFVVEAVLKLVALGPLRYLRGGFNAFDALLATISIVDLIIAATCSNRSSMGSLNALRALRVFRVVRLLKSISYLRRLRQLCAVLVCSLSSMLAIAGLLLVFMVVWALLGLSLFGPLILVPSYPNFNSFFNSFVAVFQVLTTENYAALMFSTVAASNWGATLYFLTWIVVGRWTLVTLFLAVSLSAFQESTASSSAGSSLIGTAIPSKKTSDRDALTGRAIGACWDTGSLQAASNLGMQDVCSSCESDDDGPCGIEYLSPTGCGAAASVALASPNSRCASLATRKLGKAVTFQLAANGTATAGIPSSLQCGDSLLVGHEALQKGADQPGVDAGCKTLEEAPTQGRPSYVGDLRRGSGVLASVGVMRPARASSPGSKAEEIATKSTQASGSSMLAVGLLGTPGRCTSAAAFTEAMTAGAGSSVGCSAWGVLYQPSVAAAGSGPAASRDCAGGIMAAAKEGATGLAGHLLAVEKPPATPPKRSASGCACAKEPCGSTAKAPDDGTPTRPAPCGNLPSPGSTCRSIGADPVATGQQQVLPLAFQHSSNANGEPTEQGGLGSSPACRVPGCSAGYDHSSNGGGGGAKASAPGQCSTPPAALSVNPAFPDLVSGQPLQAAALTVAACRFMATATVPEHGRLKPLDHGREAGGDEEHSVRSEPSNDSASTGATAATNYTGRTSVSRLTAYLMQKSGREHPALEGTALRIFKVDSALRKGLYQLVTAKAFECAMIVMVMLSCAQMALEMPHMSAQKATVLFAIDISVTAIFTVECLVKLVAFGFRPYWRFWSNKLDLCIVLLSIVVLASSSSSFKLLRGLRVLRALKPLRVLTRSSSMMLVSRSLALAVSGAANIAIMLLLFFVIEAILGVQLFAGKLWSCNDPAVAVQVDCVGSFEDPASGQLQERVWYNQELNFDNVGSALLTLFVVSTMDGYMPIMAAAMKIRSPSMVEPSYSNNPAAFLYFSTFIIVGGFLMTNFFTGILFEQFSRIKAASAIRSALLTPAQQEFVRLTRAVFRMRPRELPPVPANRAWAWCYRLVNRSWFELCMLGLVCCSVALMAAEYYRQPASAVQGINHAITAISAAVVLEAVAKLLAFGPRWYWRSHWNKFDGIQALTCVVDIVLEVASRVSGNTPGDAAIRLLSLVRTLRLARLVRFSRGLQSLLITLISSLPAFWNVGTLLLLVLFVYSITGVTLFGKLSWGPEVNRHANLSNFGSAMLTLFRVSTGDNWSGIMLACMAQPPDCDKVADTCGSWAAIPYFVSFFVLVPLILLEVFKAVIVDAFESEQETSGWKLTLADLEDFCTAWSTFDDGTGTIAPRDLEELLRKLSPPLGIGPRATGKDVLRFIFDLDIPLVGGRCPFHKTAFELVRRCSEAPIPELQGQLKEQLGHIMHSLSLPTQKADQIRHTMAALRIQLLWRTHRARQAHNQHATVQHPYQGSAVTVVPAAVGAAATANGATGTHASQDAGAY